MVVRYVKFDDALVSELWGVLLWRCRQRHGWKGRVSGTRGGARTLAQQQQMWDLYQSGRGAPAYNPAAPDPKHEHRHEMRNIAALGGWSQAVDVSDPEGLIAAARLEGVTLHRPHLPRETWHIEAVKKFTLRPDKPTPSPSPSNGGTVLSPKELLLVTRMRRAGIVNPIITLRESKRAGIGLGLACAILDQESGGGHNVFGHDPTNSIPVSWRGTAVTKAKYLAYRAARRAGHGMQGVGPCQLTWWATQDKADALGGCHLPGPNMRVGFAMLAASIKAHGVRAGVALYNGTGPAAQQYAHSVIDIRLPLWRKRLGL